MSHTPNSILILLRPCENSSLKIVPTGIYYALALCAAGALVGWLAGPWFAAPMALVAVTPEGGPTGLSIFLNVFDVHVTRTPIGVFNETAHSQPGHFLVPSPEEC